MDTWLSSNIAYILLNYTLPIFKEMYHILILKAFVKCIAFLVKSPDSENNLEKLVDKNRKDVHFVCEVIISGKISV